LSTCSAARAGNRRFWSLSVLRAHTKSPYKMDFHRGTLRALNRPWAARTVAVAADGVVGVVGLYIRGHNVIRYYNVFL
jgi:hypothetical protein